MSHISTTEPSGRPVYNNHFAQFIKHGEIDVDHVIYISARNVLCKLTPEQRMKFKAFGGLDKVRDVVKGELSCFGILRLDVAAMVGELGQDQPSQKTDITYAKIGHIHVLTIDQIMKAL